MGGSSSLVQNMWHKGPVLRPRCIGPGRARTQIPFNSIHEYSLSGVLVEPTDEYSSHQFHFSLCNAAVCSPFVSGILDTCLLLINLLASTVPAVAVIDCSNCLVQLTSFTIMEEHRLRAFKKGVPKKIVGPKGQVRTDWRELYMKNIMICTYKIAFW